MVLGIYGASGLGREIQVLAQQINNIEKRWDEIFFIDDNEKLISSDNMKILSFKNATNIYDSNAIEFLIAVGEPYFRRVIKEKIKNAGYLLTNIVHPSANIANNVTLGLGTIVCYNCFVSCNVVIKENVLLQPSSSIGHDSKIDCDCVISTNVCISGGCDIGYETYIGLQVPIREGIHIGYETIIGMGSVVSRDIPDQVIAIGNPARVMKNNEQHKVFK